VAAAVLTSMWRQTCSSLTFWNLAEAGFTLLTESLHALSAAPVFNDKAIEFLSKSVFLNTAIVSITIRLPLLALSLRFAPLSRWLLLC
jgi:hypothetical protein